MVAPKVSSNSIGSPPQKLAGVVGGFFQSEILTITRKPGFPGWHEPVAVEVWVQSLTSHDVNFHWVTAPWTAFRTIFSVTPGKSNPHMLMVCQSG
jgi:hypothetical protein